MLNYPNNPTGAVYSKQELEALAELLRKYPHVLIMLDEIYEFFVYDDYQHISLAQIAPDLKDRILIINGASKGYAMTGWRIGYAATRMVNQSHDQTDLTNYDLPKLGQPSCRSSCICG